MEDLRALIERAPFEGGGWNTALRAIAHATGSSRTQLIALGERHITFDWVSDVPEGFVAAASRIEIFQPDVNYRIAATAAPMEVTWEAHYDAVRARHTDEGYLDLARTFDFEHGAQIVLARQPGTFFGLAILRGDEEGRTSEDERAVFRQLAPYVLSAVRVQESIEHAGSHLLHGSLEAMGTAAILLDAQARACFVSPRAEALLGPDTLQVHAGAVRV
ncbi:helix-turn-helix transcriptional regulator, partial [Novosphingobium sp. 1949]|nr:helix-turn-helix transcriptional regulator [Novosphingobium organovorum]